MCKSEQNEFKLCRATPSGFADPKSCEGKLCNFLQCYDDIHKESAINCKE